MKREFTYLRDGPLFFIGGVTFFVKTIVRKLQLAEKNCLFQGYELKKLSAKQREIFWNTLASQNFDTNWTRHKSIFQFHLIY